MAASENILGLVDQVQDPLQFLLDITRTHGDAIQYDSPIGSTYLFNHPDYIRQVLQGRHFHRTTIMKLAAGNGLLASDGEYWKRQRRLALPFFHQNQIRQITPLIEVRTQEMLQRWRDKSDCGPGIDINSEMMRLTLQIVCEALFGFDVRHRIDDLCAALSVVQADMGAMMCANLNTPLTFEPSSRANFQKAIYFVNATASEIISEARAALPNENFLSHFLSYVDPDTGEPMTEVQIRDEVVAQIMAGHETTSIALSWALGMLSTFPNVERQLQEEVDRVLDGRLPKFEDLEKLPYTLMVLQETMRLYPPVWFIGRRSVAASKVGSLDVPANVLVGVSPYAMHRHPDFWHDPEAFDPDRFSPDSKPAKYSYLPFGGGHHLCLGMHFSLIESQLILASITQKFRIRLVSDKPLVPQPAITLRPPNEMLANPIARIGSRAAANSR